MERYEKGMSRGTDNIRWIEEWCRIPEGRHIGRQVKLRPWQRRIIRGIYDNKPSTRRAIITFGRKNGKTSLAAFLLLLHLCGNEAKANSQLFSAAQSRDQAAVLFSLAAKIVRMTGAAAVCGCSGYGEAAVLPGVGHGISGVVGGG